jgi:hypothetical protein
LSASRKALGTVLQPLDGSNGTWHSLFSLSKDLGLPLERPRSACDTHRQAPASETACGLRARARCGRQTLRQPRRSGVPYLMSTALLPSVLDTI